MIRNLDDIQLTKRVAEGDERALYQLYNKYSSAIYGVILRMCRDEDQAKDLLQETFVKIWKNIDGYDPEKGRFYTWAYRIARNTVLNSIRKQKNLIQTEDLGVYTNTEAEENPKDFTVLEGSLAQLEPHHQRAITLVYYMGHTHHEAHKVMDIPLGTFKSYIRQALKQLKAIYGRELILVWSFFEMMI
ncbi:MAG: RNA polymerase sigma factor [Bacteroidota bacterium]